MDHESGSRADRVQFKAMMADAAQRKFDVLLFWALDRLSREGVYETLTYLKRLDDAGVRFRSFTEPYLDSCGMFRDAVISILAVIAKQERIRLSERVRADLSRARAVGTRSGQPVGRPKVIFRRDRVVQLHEEGRSWNEISKETGASVTTVRRAFKEATDAGSGTTEGVEADGAVVLVSLRGTLAWPNAKQHATGLLAAEPRQSQKYLSGS